MVTLPPRPSAPDKIKLPLCTLFSFPLAARLRKAPESFALCVSANNGDPTHSLSLCCVPDTVDGLLQVANSNDKFSLVSGWLVVGSCPSDTYQTTRRYH